MEGRAIADVILFFLVFDSNIFCHREWMELTTTEGAQPKNLQIEGLILMAMAGVKTEIEPLIWHDIELPYLG